MLEKIYSDATENMDKVINHYQKEISIIRTGRASKDILDIVKVDYYGSLVPLNIKSQAALYAIVSNECAIGVYFSSLLF